MTYSPRFMKNLDQETSRNLKIASSMLGITMREFVLQAIQEKILNTPMLAKHMDMFQMTSITNLTPELSTLKGDN